MIAIFVLLKLPKLCSRDSTHPTLFLDIHFAKKMKSQGGKTLSESSSKEGTHATGSPRRTRQVVAKENTLSITPKKKEKMKKVKDVVESATRGNFDNEIVITRLCF